MSERIQPRWGVGILYLCSDAASFVTGVSLPIDGGLTALNAEHVAYKPALEAHEERRRREAARARDADA